MRIWFVDFGETSKQISRKINITNANWQFAQLYAFYVHFAGHFQGVFKYNLS